MQSVNSRSTECPYSRAFVAIVSAPRRISPVSNVITSVGVGSEKNRPWAAAIRRSETTVASIARNESSGEPGRAAARQPGTARSTAGRTIPTWNRIFRWRFQIRRMGGESGPHAGGASLIKRSSAPLLRSRPGSPTWIGIFPAISGGPKETFRPHESGSGSRSCIPSVPT